MNKRILKLSLALTFILTAFTTTYSMAESNVSETSAIDTKASGTVYFTPPEGWRQAEAKSLSPNVKIMVVGKGKADFPPSINLAVEPFKGTLKDYLKIVKSINTSKGGDWKDLGKIRTDAGEGSLSQLDTKMQWGDVRMLHTIVSKNNTIYIMTASALRDEFPAYYKQFFDAMRSLHVND